MPEKTYTMGDLAREFGLQTWQVQRVANLGKLPEHPKVGNLRVVYQSDLPACRAALEGAGYLHHGRSVKEGE